MLLKEQIEQNRWPIWTDPWTSGVPHACHAAIDVQQRQQLHDRQRTILRDYGKKLAELVLDIYTVDYQTSRTAFDRDMAQLWQQQQQQPSCVVPSNERWTPLMMDIVERRLLLITNRLVCAFTFQQRHGQRVAFSSV
jgi:hypothetical protein